MQEFSSLDEVLDFAISMEHISHQFYAELSRKAVKRDLRNLFQALAREEVLHADRLEAMKSRFHEQPLETFPAINVVGYAAAAASLEDMTYTQAVKLAVDKEQAAYMLYQLLASSLQEPALNALFLDLAQIEAQHRDTLRREHTALRICEN